MPTIFGPDWDSLELSDIEAFLQDADDEPLEWEAKGTNIDRHQVRRTVCGFANSEDGGYVILGADQRDGQWHLDGYAFPDEPQVWIDSVIRDGVRPVPAFDVRSWRVDDTNRHVAVVRVRVSPTATSPFMAGGTVYERVHGRTVRVEDPQRLARLFARGDDAREAQAKARRLRRTMLELGRQHPMYQTDRVQVALAAATTDYAPDISSRLFSPGFRDKLLELPETILLSGTPLNFVQREAQTSQDAHTLTTKAPEMGFSKGWIVRGSWDGAVGIYFVIDQEVTTSEALPQYAIAPAWHAAVDLLEILGGYGQTYVSLIACGGGHTVNVETFGADPEPGTRLDRGPIERSVDALDLDSISRELDRALGVDAFEPQAEQQQDEPQ